MNWRHCLGAGGAGPPTPDQQREIERLRARVAETLSEMACNNLGKRLWEAFPWTIFNTRRHLSSKPPSARPCSVRIGSTRPSWPAAASCSSPSASN